MGILDIFGGSSVIEKGMDLIDKKFPSDAQMLEAKTKAKAELMTAYAPFKIAQRVLAIMFAVVFLSCFVLSLVYALQGKGTGLIIEVIQAYKIDWAMTAIIMFYFGGGLAESIKRKG